MNLAVLTDIRLRDVACNYYVSETFTRYDKDGYLVEHRQKPVLVYSKTKPIDKELKDVKNVVVYDSPSTLDIQLENVEHTICNTQYVQVEHPKSNLAQKISEKRPLEQKLSPSKKSKLVYVPRKDIVAQTNITIEPQKQSTNLDNVDNFIMNIDEISDQSIDCDQTTACACDQTKAGDQTTVCDRTTACACDQTKACACDPQNEDKSSTDNDDNDEDSSYHPSHSSSEDQVI